MKSERPTICAKCRHHAWGRGVDERQRLPGIPAPGPRPTSMRGDMICLRHPRGREPINLLTGSGGETRALYCKDINRGACADYQRGVSQHAAPGLAAGVVVAVAIAYVVLYLLAH